jgi:ATP-dependent DNA helicase RecQ
LSHLQETLQKHWGYTDFINPQKEIIEKVLEGKDVLAILPTGGGKSICYQLPAILKDGITLVISPLIALMNDQIEQLKAKNIGAASITSQLNSDQISPIFAKCQLGEVKILYVAPERLQNKNFIRAVGDLKVDFIAVDEAHCIAEWGHDFRPAYLKIKKIREIFPKANVLALTATATKKVREEIISSLVLREVEIFRKSLKRENLVYKVKKSFGLDDLVYELNKNKGPGIVFTRTRKETFELANFLKEKGFDVDFFHSKIPNDEKNKKQEDWTKSETQIMVSTNAFGMGIDKPDVRAVVHWDFPSGIESYIQEAGRAGRDGKYSEAVLFLKSNSRFESEEIFKSSLPDKNEFEKIIRMFYNHFEIGENEKPENLFEFSLFDFIRKFNLNKKKTKNVLEFIERKEFIRISPQTNQSKIQILVSPKQIQNSKSVYYKIIEFLLRNHSNILNEKCAISEFRIAKSLEKSTKKIRETLLKMEKIGFISYQSQNVLNIKLERPRETNFVKNILWKEFEDLQNLKWKRLQDLIFYAEQNEICREKLLLRYFGEKTNENCGKCDVCKNDKTMLNSASVLEFLEDSPKNIQQIFLHFINSSKESILQTLQQLIDEDLVESYGIDSYKKSGL